MKIYNKLFKALFLSGAILLSSCSDFLEEKAFDFVDSTIIGEDLDAAKKLTNGVIAILNEGDFFQHGKYTKIQENDTDDLTAGSWAMGGYGSGNFMEWYLTSAWYGPYALIYRCNKAIKMITEMKGIEPEDEAERQNCLGQIYFLKAWAYFQLVRAYGPIPIYKEIVNTPAEYHRPRMPIPVVYEYIIEQLKLASNNLYDKRDGRYELGRISKYAAKTLLAQVYTTMASASMPEGTQLKVMGGPAKGIINGTASLYPYPIQITHSKKQVPGYNFNSTTYYTLAKELCDSIIQFGGYALYDNYMESWKYANRNGMETIWALQASMDQNVLKNGISSEFSGWLDPDKPQFLSGALYGPRNHWYELFEENDVRIKDGVLHRFAFWEKGGDGPDKHDPWFFFYPLKDSLKVAAEDPYFGYKKTDVAHTGLAILRKFEGVSDRTEALSDFHYPFLRYASVYLMLAEAECELGNVAGAQAAVDVIRSRSKASTIIGKTGMSDKVELRSFILEERRREMAMEGYRKWDLLRWGIYVSVMSAIDIDESDCIKRRQDRHIWLPIPNEELNANDSINVNNPGW